MIAGRVAFAKKYRYSDLAINKLGAKWYYLNNKWLQSVNLYMHFFY